MSADSFLYFAYGSNMPTERIRARCPSAKALGVSELPGYELRWHKPSIDKSGKCDVVASDVPGTSVFGVIYKIDASEKASLDSAEGKDYGVIEIEVLSGTQTVRAVLYRAKVSDPALRPYTWYHALVIAGAKEHGLPASYISGLESVPADEDENRSRHDERMALITEVQA